MSLDVDDRVLLHAQLFDSLDLLLQWLSETGTLFSFLLFSQLNRL